MFSDDADTFFYVTATRQLGEGSFTAGAGTDGDARGFFGASYPINNSLTAIGEYITGDEGFALVGAAYKLTKSFSLAGWYQEFNEEPSDRFVMDLIYQHQF